MLLPHSKKRYYLGWGFGEITAEQDKLLVSRFKWLFQEAKFIMWLQSSLCWSELWIVQSVPLPNLLSICRTLCLSFPFCHHFSGWPWAKTVLNDSVSFFIKCHASNHSNNMTSIHLYHKRFRFLRKVFYFHLQFLVFSWEIKEKRKEKKHNQKKETTATTTKKKSNREYPQHFSQMLQMLQLWAFLIFM